MRPLVGDRLFEANYAALRRFLMQVNRRKWWVMLIPRSIWYWTVRRRYHKQLRRQ